MKCGIHWLNNKLWNVYLTLKASTIVDGSFQRAFTLIKSCKKFCFDGRNKYYKYKCSKNTRMFKLSSNSAGRFSEHEKLSVNGLSGFFWNIFCSTWQISKFSTWITYSVYTI